MPKSGSSFTFWLTACHLFFLLSRLGQVIMSDYEETTANRRAEVELYLAAMQVFCDLENGKAFNKEYIWPDLLHWQRPAKIN
jgi:hypothetical protein